VTGAAGFIGSNLVEHLLAQGAKVIGVDNFITGKRANLAPFADRLTFVEGDVRDLALCRRLCQGVDYVLHEAALGSVPRSVDDPLTTHDHNVNGTVNVLVAARDAGVKRVVFAASSAAYGDTEVLPKVETMPPNPLSPYAVTKLVGEQYVSVFHRVYGQGTVALRYFNVFGPRQDPDGMYAAVIPRFLQALLRGQRPVIYGDGEQTRDFCFVENVVQANLRACTAPAEACGQVFNVGAAGRVSLNALLAHLARLLGTDLPAVHEPARAGDVRDSQADIGKARRLLGYDPQFDVFAGLDRAIDWYRANLG
jgi:nucleoside-diphosphate-sugar epimerase